MAPTGKIITLAGNPQDENSFEQPKKLSPQESVFNRFSKQFTYDFAPMSYTIMRVRVTK